MNKSEYDEFDEYDEYIKDFINNLKFFTDCSLEDFIYLASLKPCDYTKKDNFLRTFCILSEIDNFARIYENGTDVITSMVKEKNVTDKRFEQIIKLSETCHSFLMYLSDNNCYHPILDISFNTCQGEEFYEMMFSSFESVLGIAKDKNPNTNDYFELWNKILNEQIRIKDPFENEAYNFYNWWYGVLKAQTDYDEKEGIEYVFNNYMMLDDKSLIFHLSEAINDKYIKTIQGTYYANCEDSGFKNDMITNKDIAAINLCSKQSLHTRLMEILMMLRDLYGDIILDDDYELEDDEYNDRLDDNGDLCDKSSVDYEDLDGYNGINLIATNTVNDNYSEEVPDIRHFVNHMLDSYYRYKNREYNYMLASQEVKKRIIKRQDM